MNEHKGSNLWTNYLLKKQYAPQNSRLHPEHIQAISHAQPKWPSFKSELVLVTLMMTFIVKAAQIPNHVIVATS